MVISTAVSIGESINDETNIIVNRTENLLKILTGLVFTRCVRVKFGTT